MNQYPRGKEPPCPVKLAGCTGKIRCRGARCCGACSNAEKSLRSALKQPARGPMDAVTVNGDACEITKTTTQRVKTLADLVRVCDIDTTTWTVERYVCSKWDMAAVPRATGNDKDGWTRTDTEPIVTELYQVKVWLKRNVMALAARAEITALIAEAKRSIVHAATPVHKRKPAGGYMLELAVPDLHAGKLAWANETGHAHYDAKIAEQVFQDAIERLLDRTSSYRFDEIVFVVGNDLLHTDNKAQQTNSGTQLDADGRFHKTFGIVRRMITRVIEARLSPLAPVRALIVPGNHDTLAAWHLGDSLECYFHNRKDITIDNAPSLRKYHRFGKVMLMFTHGDKGKRPDYPLLMATEQPEMFGATVHREAHTGHRHAVKAEEYHGVKVRVSPALCPPDAWHSENTFVGNARSAEAFIWHQEQGLVGTAIYTVPVEPR